MTDPDAPAADRGAAVHDRASPPNYARRRAGMAAIALLMLCAGQEARRPMIGTLSITMDDATHVPQVSGEWAPPLALAAAVVAQGAAFVEQCLAP